jgi:hypothetical protein
MAPFEAIRMAWGDLFEIDVFPGGDSRPGDGDAQAGDVRPASVKWQLLRWDGPFSGGSDLSLYRSDSVGGSCLAARLDGHAEPSPADTPCCTPPSLPLPPPQPSSQPEPDVLPAPNRLVLRSAGDTDGSTGVSNVPIVSARGTGTSTARTARREKKEVEERKPHYGSRTIPSRTARGGDRGSGRSSSQALTTPFPALACGQGLRDSDLLRRQRHS